MLFKEDVYEQWECQQAFEDKDPVGLLLKKHGLVTKHRTSVTLVTCIYETLLIFCCR